MIKKSSKIAVALLSAGLMVGCASKSDLNALKGRVDDLENSVKATSAKADQALAASQSAEAAAKRAAASADEVNAKLDRMFKHSMKK
ncbi:Lpp/OprI family alanine-zipper lipoprotein [Methylogaea oryzae]|uniref:Murein lipoprotein n=1 Tax=Methylogaea oryzae TaxID=1295382 RepID=A0A8D4VNS1_9GAMM|nr:Lpp/OprI family alanine-zipper lipoprotein [Methylogaea oryzae]BBL70457.1 hypothetical protein MoryE10_10630 [Methylogaea oryzae]